MSNKEVIEQLESLKAHCESMRESGEEWEKDVRALEYAIRELERTAQEVPVQEQLKTILGNDITIFVKDEGSNCYEAEIADSRKRIKLLNIELRKVSKSRYCVTDYQSF